MMFKNVSLGIAPAVFLAGCSGADGVSEYELLGDKKAKEA